ncbi:hypothetical protein CMI37_30820 [Candidatus Pacearchaeota archaeon]|nr:hypothetical protein [Candidatus Pacearchaeota archaeon]|tara:strand:- start:1668 stop:2390 length:723 start_codon:yes stop_codon:yes gene_type:complete
MARTHAKGTDILIDEFSFTGISNSVGIDIANGNAEVTAFADTAATYAEGKPATNITVNAVYQVAEDAALFAVLGEATDNYLSISPAAMADGGIVWITKAHLTGDTIPTPFDSAVTLNATWAGTDPIGDGVILERDTNITSTVTGAAVQQGAVSSTQKIMCFLHVLSAAGGTLDVTIQSDNGAGFGSPTTRLTFSQVTTTAGAWVATANGAITDDYWRCVAAAGGGSPVYNIAVTFAIIPL